MIARKGIVLKNRWDLRRKMFTNGIGIPDKGCCPISIKHIFDNYFEPIGNIVI